MPFPFPLSFVFDLPEPFWNFPLPLIGPLLNEPLSAGIGGLDTRGLGCKHVVSHMGDFAESLIMGPSTIVDEVHHDACCHLGRILCIGNCAAT